MVQSVECQVREDLCQNVNSTTKTIVFESTDQRNVSNWKIYYKDQGYIGKHFLVRNIGDGSSIYRHYTICNAMRPDIYSAYIAALKPDTDPAHKAFDSRILDVQNQN